MSVSRFDTYKKRPNCAVDMHTYIAFNTDRDAAGQKRVAWTARSSAFGISIVARQAGQGGSERPQSRKKKKLPHPANTSLRLKKETGSSEACSYSLMGEDSKAC